ncbi:esterase [Nocardioides flavus (ex Wang et al. 2016)]|uniref:Esterase n=1 Tax=Nocardioides flavus (ex Wang et al. 2016) TaxID=2058780 RepID=A0ABQ3HJ18_9ACTN|nr:alpha/beta hydrolase-fold protein [Nocardioides flavus (ex Wang et al. 2016)]GHE16659.1 esterase [Nocardioides flavus (ex Wang et al. 2016)]
MDSGVPFRPLPIDQSHVLYEHGPDSAPRPGVTPGRTTRLQLAGSEAFPGTTRDVWVHAPSTTDDALPCMVFQDGGGFLDPEDDLRAGVVLDNLIAAGDIPPMVGVFVDPVARNAEYDAFDSRYADLLADEVLPLVGQHVPIRDDPAQRGTCGFSSGGSAALTAAWHRPDAFGKVIGFSSSFPQVVGGNPWAEVIASEPARPLRVLLQVGHRDLGWDEPEDNWLVENLLVAAALVRAGYDARLVLGDGAHDSNHPGVLLPDALRWLWR